MRIDQGTPQPANAAGLQVAAQRFGHLLGARIRIGRAVAGSGQSELAGRTGRVIRQHFAGVYLALDRRGRERVQRTVLIILERRGQLALDRIAVIADDESASGAV